MVKSSTIIKTVLSLLAIAAVVALIVFLVFKTNSDKKQLQAELERFMDTEIHIPKLSTAIFDGREMEVRRALQFYNFEWPVFIDSSQEFIALNPELPEIKHLHTFLLDQNNRVVLIGEPLHNPELWRLYVSTIMELINNDGVLTN